jgi:hypothetical protein
MHFGIEIKKCLEFFGSKNFQKIKKKFHKNSEIFGPENLWISKILNIC